MGLKLFSIGAAVILYLVAMNSEDPIMQTTISRAVSIRNEDSLRRNDFILLNTEGSMQVRITVSGKRSDINKFNSQTPGLSAYLDLSIIGSAFDTTGQPIPLSVHVDVPPEYTLINKDPREMSVVIDDYVAKTVIIEATPVGEARDNFQVMQWFCSPGSVEITGARSVVESVGVVSVGQISIDNASRDVIAKKRPIVYDNDNMDVTSKVGLNVDEVTVEVPVYPIKEINVEALRAAVFPADGYRVDSVEVSPQTVLIVGKQTELDRFDRVYLDSIREEGVSEDVVVVYDIRDYLRNYNVEVKRDSPYEATVTVRVVREAEKELVVPVGRFSILKDSPDYIVDLVFESVTVTLRGPQDVLDAITPLSFSYSATLDLSGRKPGAHAVYPSFSWPEGIKQVNPQIPVEVEIISTEDDGDGPDAE